MNGSISCCTFPLSANESQGDFEMCLGESLYSDGWSRPRQRTAYMVVLFGWICVEDGVAISAEATHPSKSHIQCGAYIPETCAIVMKGSV